MIENNIFNKALIISKENRIYLGWKYLYVLNTFKKELESMFDLDPLEINTWEIVRREFVSKIEKNQRNY